jgi:hypothetical protein
MKARAKIAAALALALVAALAWWADLPTARRSAPIASDRAETPRTSEAELPPTALAGPEDARREAPPEARASPPAPERPAPAFEGRVRDVGGNPVGPIAVYREAETRDRGEPFALAGADGVFTWSTPEWTALVAESDELTTVLPAFAGSDACAIVVAPRRSYAGFVIDESGTGLADVRLHAQMDAAMARRLLAGKERASARTWVARSGADGAFALEGVGWTEELALVARLDGFVEARVALPPENTRGLEILLRQPARGARSVSGVVVDPAAEPVVGATVAFETGKGVTSDREGRFVIEAPPGRQSAVLWAVQRGRAPARHEFADLEAYLASTPRAQLVLTLGERPESIGGVVVDGDGAPVAGAWVFTWDMQRWAVASFVESLLTDQDFPGRASTGPHGRFSVEGLLPRPYTLHAPTRARSPSRRAKRCRPGRETSGSCSVRRRPRAASPAGSSIRAASPSRACWSSTGASPRRSSSACTRRS